MDLVTPAIGLIFWTVLIFIILLILLGKFAWKPILNAVRSRNNSIEEALKSADRAKAEMEQLSAKNEEILREARIERDKILKEARQMQEKTIEDAKTQAKEEASAIIASAKAAIENEKRSAINDIKNQVAQLSVEIAEKVLAKELSNKESQQALIEDLLNKTNIN